MSSIDADFHRQITFLTPREQAMVMASFRTVLTQVDVRGIRTALGLLSSAVKSGEPWSPECEERHRKAVAAAKRLTIRQR